MNPLKNAFYVVPLFIVAAFFLGENYDPVTTTIDINNSIPSEDLEWIKNEVYESAEENNIPALVVGIIHQGELAAYVQSGYFSRNSEQAVTPKTPFQIASLSKTFTGIIANNLLQEGVLDSTKAITQYLPASLSDAARSKLSKTTVLDLLHHQSGFPWDAKYAKRVLLGGPMYGNYDESDLMKDLEELEINPDQVGHFSYSNLGYGTLGYILEELTGKPYEELLQEYIVQPLALENTTTLLDATNLPTPYRPEWKRIKTKPWKMGLLRAGGGGIFFSGRFIQVNGSPNGCIYSS